jgi:hypothetical protein
MILALTGIWLAISVMEVIPFFNPKYLGECLELIFMFRDLPQLNYGDYSDPLPNIP